ncbi:hypothetical protein EHRUM2_02710 [Ehrlichia ruminantium]|uniref:Uncharacterized protein n=2 Tax=Ehrlichia ruminantium TaxID=779 RepID=A0A170RQN7_EHRRU|nr:hypothetical protein EHRUM2_02710 [Ehrlichia ruminantium]
MHDITNIIITVTTILTIIIVLNIVLFYMFSLLINQNDSYKANIITLKVYPHTLSKDSIKKMLSKNNEHTIIEKNIESNPLNLNILINSIDLTTLEKKSQQHHQHNNYIELLHFTRNMHTQYLSQVLNIAPNTKKFNNYTNRINLATFLSTTFSIFCTVVSTKFIPPTLNIIHELVTHLHHTGYEALSYNTLTHILKHNKKYTITMTNKKIEFLLTNTSNKLGVNISTNMSICKRTNPNIKYNVSTIYSFNISQLDQTYNSDILYTNMYFTLFFPKTMRHFINIEGHYTVQNSTKFLQENANYPILIFHTQDYNNQCIIQYKLPCPITVHPLTELQLNSTEDREPTKQSISTATQASEQQRKALHLQVETDGISHFVVNPSHKKK